MSEILELVILMMRLVTALVLIAFLPGSALTWWLFSKSRLDLIERLFISVITSLILSGFVAYGLVLSGFGVSPAGLIIALGLLTVIFMAGAMHARRWQGTFKEIAVNRYNWVLIWLRKGMPLTMLSGMFAVALIIGGAIHLRMAQDTNTLALTEFYINQNRLAGDGVRYIANNGVFEVTVSITNHERQDMAYRIESTASSGATDTAGLLDVAGLIKEDAFIIDNIKVAASDSWTGTVSVVLPDNPVEFIEINLFNEESQNVYSTLRVWLFDR